MQFLRAAVDAQKVLSRKPVAPARYAELVALIDAHDGHLPMQHGGCTVLRRARVTESAIEAGRGDGLGLWLYVRRTPDDLLEQARAEKRGQPWAQWDSHGSALSASRSGLEVIRAHGAAVAALLYPGESFDELAARWLEPGETHIAVDAAFLGPHADAVVSREVFADDNTRVARRCWTTRAPSCAREDMRVADDGADDGDDLTRGQGDVRHGRTLYVGRKGGSVELCVYERSKHRGDGHWLVLEETLRACGWDGTSPVTRSEWRLSREWLRDQVCELPDGRELRGNRLALAEWFAVLPEVLAGMIERYRHHVLTAGPRGGERREISRWWRAVQGHAVAWFARELGRARDDEAPLARFVAKRREEKLRTAVTRGADGAAKFMLAAAVPLPLALATFCDELAARVATPEGRADLRSWLRRVGYGLCLPFDPVAGESVVLEMQHAGALAAWLRDLVPAPACARTDGAGDGGGDGGGDGRATDGRWTGDGPGDGFSDGFGAQNRPETLAFAAAVAARLPVPAPAVAPRRADALAGAP